MASDVKRLKLKSLLQHRMIKILLRLLFYVLVGFHFQQRAYVFFRKKCVFLVKAVFQKSRFPDSKRPFISCINCK